MLADQAVRLATRICGREVAMVRRLVASIGRRLLRAAVMQVLVGRVAILSTIGE